MKTDDIQKLITAALAALTPVMNAVDESDSLFTRAEKTQLGLAYYTLVRLNEAMRQSRNEANCVMPWEDD